MNLLLALQRTLSFFRFTQQSLRLLRSGNGPAASLQQQWAQESLARMNVELKVLGVASNEASLLFVGNHISYLDIPLLMSVLPSLSFVAKQEVKSWPLFGNAAARLNTVFVKRERDSSRTAARKAISEALLQGHRIAIFPSGTTSLNESKPWRRGAFEIAQATGSKVQPFRITYRPARKVAYIDRDFFPWHLFQLFRTGGFQAVIEFHPPVDVSNPTLDSLYWQYWSQGLIESDHSERFSYGMNPALRPV